MPIATIALPTYNRADFIGEALQRLLSFAGLADVEIIVSDNASEDHTPDVLKRFQADNLQVFRQDTNIGALANFDFILSKARGDFFILHQDDDSIDEGFLAAFRRAAREVPEFEVFATSYWRGNPGKGLRSEIPALLAQECERREHAGGAVVVPGRDLAPLFLFGMPIINPGMAYRTSTLRTVGGFGFSTIWGSDVYLTTKLLLRGNLAYCPVPWVTYREHDTNYSRSVARSEQYKGYRELYGAMVQLLDEAGVPWQGIVAQELATKSSSELLTVLRRWVRSDCPRDMTETAWRCYAAGEKRLAMRYWQACSKLGPRSLWKMLCGRLPGRAPAAARTDGEDTASPVSENSRAAAGEGRRQR
jgi:glycosyltransferase involved in cell wall biosynthesis